MNIKTILIAGLLLIMVVSCSSATISLDSLGCACTQSPCYDTINYGEDWICYARTQTGHYGSYTGEARVSGGGAGTISYYHSDGGCGASSTPCGSGGDCPTYRIGCTHGSARVSGDVTLYAYAISQASSTGSCAHPRAYSKAYYGEDFFTISGNACGNGLILLLDSSDNILSEWDTSEDYNYIFDIMDNTTYKISFSDHVYEFTVDGTNIEYNNNLCVYITLNFRDNCGNLLRETEFQYCNHLETINCYLDETSSGSYDILFEDQDYLEIWAYSAMGTLYYNISNPSDSIDYTILNPVISWNNNIMVVDGNTSGLIPILGALVTFSQDCIIDPSIYPSRNKFTDSNGFANFEECELDTFSLGVSANGYHSYSGGISSSAMHNFILSQTVMIKLYPVGDEENESEYIYTDYDTNIYFKDINGNYTTSILDTDDYVDLYYYNNNSDGESMTLKFQKYSIETGTIDLLSWNIPIDTDGYKRILKSNYTDTPFLYIGYLYNYVVDGWDKTEYLNVKNETSEIDLDYQNLTAFTWFEYKNVEGSIDYREDINIIGYANTTYVGLFIISLELYDNGVYTDHINLTWADFISADLKYFYEWTPSHSYVNGHNYTVRMHGYDYYLLDVDYVNATDYRKNKLTILVKDSLGNNLVNSFVFLDGYGSLSTGISHFNSYENLEDGYYRYRASKSGYEDAGWDDITLSGSDEVVTYTLTATDSAEGNATQQKKMQDDDLKNIYLLFMAFLLLMILFGGFIYVM